MQTAGWVETTYLDEDFRVGRGDKGSVFVTARLGKAKEAAPQPAAAVAQPLTSVTSLCMLQKSVTSVVRDLPHRECVRGSWPGVPKG